VIGERNDHWNDVGRARLLTWNQDSLVVVSIMNNWTTECLQGVVDGGEQSPGMVFGSLPLLA
jgi:hypothetical protein